MLVERFRHTIFNGETDLLEKENSRSSELTPRVVSSWSGLRWSSNTKSSSIGTRMFRVHSRNVLPSSSPHSTTSYRLPHGSHTDSGENIHQHIPTLSGVLQSSMIFWRARHLWLASLDLARGDLLPYSQLFTRIECPPSYSSLIRCLNSVLYTRQDG